MNSSNNTATGSRFDSVRLARWLFCLVWNRRMGWFLACLGLSVALYYPWENWRSAKELAGAHQRLLERLGTDDLMAFSPAKIADQQNYFALPVVERWAAEPLEKGSILKRYNIPQHVFLPPDFTRPEILEDGDDGTSGIDFDTWAVNRDLKGEPPAVVMNRELGDGNGLLPQLSAGLNRPFSSIKPGYREALESAAGNPLDLLIPDINDISGHTRDLALHLRCAAAAGDVVKARQTALITLRLFPESAAAYTSLVGCLVSLATHETAFAALQDALGRPVWDEASLHAVQAQLAKIDDCEQLEKTLSCEMLWGYRAGEYLISHRQERSPPITSLLFSGDSQNSIWQSLRNKAGLLAEFYGPIGWHHANLAFYTECWLEILGSKSDRDWQAADGRSHAVHRHMVSECLSWSYPRRVTAAIAFPRIGSIFSSAAKTLFHRRCLIIACALERHRQSHGSFPASLDAVQAGLQLFQVTRSAPRSQLPAYRLENDGYLLWSAGLDGKDDGGVQVKDWLWRMKRR
ncbi:MAG: hypothetical protein ACO1TE_18010 [Prosthecobacter sp.]